MIVYNLQRQKGITNKVAIMIAFVMLLFGSLMVFNVISLQTVVIFFHEQLSGFTDGQQSEEKFYDGQSAYDIALPEAQKWRSDAVLSSISSGAADEEGDYWKLTFISTTLSDVQYFIVEVRDNKIIVK